MFQTIDLGQKTNILIGGTSGWKVDVNQLLNRAQVPFFGILGTNHQEL